MAEAVEEGYVSTTPSRRIKLPRVEHNERRFLTTEEVDSLAQAAGEYAALIYTGAYLGLRPGELLGLKRQHLHLLKRQLRVVGSVERVDNGYRYVEETKSSSGRRMIPIPLFLVDMLAAHLAAASDSEFVFCSPTGKLFGYHNFRQRVWNPAVERAGIGKGDPTRATAHGRSVPHR